MAKFELPILTFLETKLRENFPEFDLREGTAYRDMLIKPMALLIQPLRDQINIIERNLSLGNFPLMLEDEFDALTQNIFVSRRTGDRATGAVRVFFDTPTDVVIGTDVKFLTEDGRAFALQEAVVITAETMKFNQEGLLFFVDGDIIADDAGGDVVDVGGIIFIEGGPATATSVTNKAAITSGVPAETNTELFARTQDSIATRNLVTKRSISAVLLEQFNAIREVQVIGFGDPEMDRDIISVALSLGEVLGTKTTGEITTPDTFEDTSGVNFILEQVAAGHELVVETGPNAGSFIITDVVSATELEVDPDFVSNEAGVTYRIAGFIIKDDLHIGGKVDVYHDTTSISVKEIIIDPIPLSLNVFVNRPSKDGSVLAGDDKLSTSDFDFVDEEVTTSDQIEILAGVNIGTFDILAVSTNELTLDTTGFIGADDRVKFQVLRSYYSNGVDFTTPVIAPDRVIRLDPITLEEIGSELVEDSDFFIRANDPLTRFSPLESVFFEFDSPFSGSTMKIQYQTDDTIPASQDFMESDDNRVVTADILAKHALPAFVDLDIEYTGNLDETSAVNAVTDFINTIQFTQTLQKSDIIAVLYAFSADFVVSDFTMTATVTNSDGTKTVVSDTDELQITRLANFIARDITATKIGA